MAIGKKIATNTSASLLKLFDGVPIFGPGRSTKKAWKEGSEAISDLWENGSNTAKRISNTNDRIQGAIEGHAKKMGLEDDDAVEKLTQSILEGNANTKFGMSEKSMNTIRDRMNVSDKMENELLDSTGKALMAPVNIAKNYMLEGSPLRTYAKAAIPYVGYQMATGQRESLTQKNGQRDIAGIPFV